MHATIPLFEQWPNSEESTLFLRKLLENDGFRYEFAQRSCTYMELLFHPDRVDQLTDSLVNLIDPYVDLTLEKWGENIPELGWGQAMGGSREKWEENIQLYKDFFVERPAYMRKYIGEYCRLEGSYHLTLGTDAHTRGKVYVNSNRKELPPGFGADYFKNIPLQLLAVPDEGYAFLKWKETDDPQADIDFVANEQTTLTPLFISASSVPEYGRAQIHVYPNPGKGRLYIQLNDQWGGQVKVGLYNSAGQLVLNETIVNAAGEVTREMDLGHLRDGTYWLRARSEETQMVKQVILIR
jgi:hypothetical protein